MLELCLVCDVPLWISFFLYFFYLLSIFLSVASVITAYIPKCFPGVTMELMRLGIWLLKLPET